MIRRLSFSFGLLATMGVAASAQTAVRSGEVRAIRSLIWSGHLDSAETMARAGGARTMVVLGDVFVLRGRLSQADSIYRAAIIARVPQFRSAMAGQIELAVRRGDGSDAIDGARTLLSEYVANGNRWSADDITAAGRAYVILGGNEPQAFHDALQAFDRAASRDSSDIESRIRAANLLLAKYNAPDAKQSYEEVLAIQHDEPRALLGLADVHAFSGDADATSAVRASLRADPVLVPALVLLAQLHLGAEAYDSAATTARRALAVDSSTVEAWAVLGAIAWMNGDSVALMRARDAAHRAAPGSVVFTVELAEAAGRQRRYADAAAFALEAARADSQSARALGVLGENQLRIGDMANGRANLERAFAIDPYNLWHKNTLDLLDLVRTFRTTNIGRFQFVAPPGESDYLTLYLAPLLEAAYDSFSVRYGYRPPTPIRVEYYGRHADFSVRTVGLTGLGALGVSFGTVLVLDSPQARSVGELNYGSTSWHELAHTFTLGLSKNRVPRWISEGLSVHEERRAGHGWGAQATADFLATYKGGALPSATQINEGLVRPKFPEEIGYSYYEASLVCAMIEAEHGIEAIRAILRGFADGLDLRGVLQKVLNTTPDAFDHHFDTWLRARYATALATIDSSDGKGDISGRYISMMREGVRLLATGQGDSARAVLRRAQEIFPDDGSADGPAWLLARADRDAGNLRAAAEQAHTVATHNETALVADSVEAELRLQLADSTGAIDALDREQWIGPYNVSLHLRIADLSEKTGDLRRAVLERRAILALAPADPLEARYQLARVLLRSGDRAAARSEVLRVLEAAPAFEKAQALLLEIQGSST